MRSEGKFYDDKNFPRGFNRSGVFTISEAALLLDYGRTMKGLTEGTLEAISEPERQFLAEIQGQLEVQSDFAKCWLKYTSKTTQKVRSYTLCVSQRKQYNQHDDDNESDIENDLDY
ncbi:MaoP family protein [Photobacterium alginatilyticum]|uniref:Macrodomain Ori protein n=1 Tax=Photobacterium alginatilyticum TaxID=1775171 RepID=A0ABW9YJZ4_9GAMM|nr:DUF413 domain-containing protein [Photobacterium alginatilyticum]NBI54075.1 DUF413 domain-containing protein [Photobacterium alginatilyticum]